MKNLELQRRQLDRIFAQLRKMSEIAVPKSGWVRAIRTALGMPLSTAAKKIGMTPEGVIMLEKREAEGSITLNGLREVARSLDCTLLYAIIPNANLQSVLSNEAARIANGMMRGATATMTLESQSTSDDEAMEERRVLIEKLIANPKLIWKAQG